jgi:diaminohydroxyphosphoribosylaminopyrimidine deaminase/5-amino-6-(5-phosphoribosylamino)uracil reductase
MANEMDEKFIRRTFELADKGRGLVSPNPMVGCVIVKDDKIVSEGFHKKYGEAHAEVEAINAIEDKNLFNGATLYVNLEPCAHFGKTPPCADLIAKFPFKKVVICNLDPNPLVSGKGIEKIKAAGIEVEEGILSAAGRVFNRRFFTFIEKKRPYVILKWAETADGFVAKDDYSSKWISNENSRKLVHKWRSEEDSVMVGTNTAIYDNPKLNVRDWEGRDPIRIILDKNLRIPQTSFVYDKTQRTIFYNSIKEEVVDGIEYAKIKEAISLSGFLVGDLHVKNIQSVMIEGGARLLNEFIQTGLWDEIRIFKSKEVFEKGIESPGFSGKKILSKMIEDDELCIYRPE